MRRVLLSLIVAAPSPQAAADCDQWQPGITDVSSVEAYESQYAALVAPFLKAVERRGEFPAADGKPLAYASYERDDERGALVLVDGRSTSYLHDGELVYDLYQRCYSVYVYDHRGQGLSPRLIAGHPELGYVESYDHYVADLRAFRRQVVGKRRHVRTYEVATSMGGAVALLDATSPTDAAGPPPVDGLALLAPLLGIQLPYPEWLVSLKLRFGAPTAPANGDTEAFEPMAFEGNPLASNRPRFQRFMDAFQREPRLKVGAASNQWVAASIAATRQLAQRAKLVRPPLLIFQAGLDTVVRNADQTAFCSAAPSCELVPLPAARHGIMLEDNEIRKDVLARLGRFIERQRSASSP